MSNKDGIISFQEITSGSYAFLWQTIVGGYKLLEGPTHKAVVDSNIIDSNDSWLVRKTDKLPFAQHRYPPLSKPTLHREFARLYSDESIIKFANKYGMLGHVEMVAPSSGGEVSYAESLTRWKNESRDMGRLLAIWDMVMRRDAGKLGQLIKWPSAKRVLIQARIIYDQNRGEWGVKPWASSDKAILPWGGFGVTIADAEHKNSDILSRWKTYSVVEPAKCYVLEEINEKLKEHVAPKVFLPEDTNAIPSKIYLVPDSLLAALWVLFLMEVTGRTRVRRCDHCGNWKELRYNRPVFYCSKACKQAAYREKKKAVTTLRNNDA